MRTYLLRENSNDLWTESTLVLNPEDAVRWFVEIADRNVTKPSRLITVAREPVGSHSAVQYKTTRIDHGYNIEYAGKV